MNEPRRLSEEAESPLEEALLQAGRSYGVSSSSHRRTLMALGLAGTATVSATASGLSAFGEKALQVFQLGPVKWLAAASIVAAPAAYLGVRAASTSEPTPIAAPSEPSGSGDAEIAAAPVIAEAAASPSSPPVQAEEPAVSEVAPNRVPRDGRTARRATLSQELQSLDSVRSELARGDVRAALGALDSYARAFPRGRLQLEAEVLRIDALARSGQQELARRRAEAFLRRAPKSVLASRVRRYVNSD
ncbi:MAG TPA: hypothetical protein VFQ61_06830 [Polyangiaceae bacterium]|nr:hypothetical protein [Polyangiaceae bacterium]